MQRLAEICIRRPIFASMLILALVVVGAAAWFKLGVDRLPSVDLPVVTVRTVYTGASPEEVESEVSRRIEDAVNQVDGITELRSVSGPGMSFVVITFDLKKNIEVATQDVRDRVAAIQRDLTRLGADPPTILKQDNDDQPIMTLALSGERSVRELTEIADKTVKMQLERSGGVGEVRIIGGLSRQMNIWLDAAKVASYKLPVTAVRDAIAAQNANTPGGNVTGAQYEHAVRTVGKLQDAEAFNDIVVAKINGQLIRVRDLGRAEDGAKEQRSVARLNGKPTVSLEIRRQSGANTVATIEAIKASLARVESQLPPDVRVEILRDQSRYIYSALHEINTHLLLGSALACGVVLLFMRNLRATIIAGIAIPTSVISTFAMMWMLGFTLNSVTMLALVLMVGIVIDDAIVVLENIFRFVEEKKMSAFDAAREATREIGLAVLATTMSLVIIFIPVSFMSSVSGRFLYQFGITAAVAVLVSLLVSFTLTPMMSARLMRTKDVEHEAKSRGGFYGVIDGAYSWMLRLSMRWRYAVAILAIGVIACSVPLYGMVKQEFVPSDVDEAEFMVIVNGPEGISIGEMEKAMRDVEEEVLGIRGVDLVLSTTGGGFVGSVNQSSMYVRIAPHDNRVWSVPRFLGALVKGDPGAAFRGNYSQTDVIQEVRKRLRKFPKMRAQARNFPSFSTGGGFFDLDIAFRGPELKVLAGLAEELRARAEKIGGVANPDTTLKLDKPELQIEPMRSRAGDLGFNAGDIGTAIRLLIGGDERVSRFRDEQVSEDYDVQIRLMEKDRLSPNGISTLYITRRDGALVDFANIAKVHTAQIPARIDRLDRQRAANMRGSVAPGYAQADRIAALRAQIADMNLPAGYRADLTGRGKELERTFTEFLWAFLLSVIFMYIILAMNYESLVHPFTILLSLPLSVPFALLSLWATAGTLNLYSALGILVLFGVVKKNAILQIDHMNQLRGKGMPRAEAIIQGCRDRLRPILMTTMALVAGMLPLALGTGPGAEERRAVAIVVIGGQTLSLLLTLLVTPVTYSLLDDAGALVRRLRGKHEPVPAYRKTPAGDLEHVAK